MSVVRHTLVLALVPLALAPLRAQSPEPSPAVDLEGSDLRELRFGVHVELIEGELWTTVRTEDAPLRPLLEELADQARVEFSGLERLPATLRVTADLERRPLRQVVAWILGSVGLRADRRLDTFTLHVDADTREDLLNEAQTEYLRALREFPNHPLADRALYGQGLLEEDRGQPAAARAHYDALIEAYPASPIADQVLKRSAELFEAEGEWAAAAQKWSQLLRLESGSSLEALAYEQLALCTALLGDPDRALHMLDALESDDPAQSPEQRQERLYIRARGLLGKRLHHQALEVLAEADAYERTREQRLTSCELRATALRGLEEYGAASRSWLAYCELASGDELAAGLARAAEDALRAGDELGVLFIERLAAKHGVEKAVAGPAREARTRLDLVSGKLSGQADVERLARAERLVAAGLFEEAVQILSALAPRAALFAEPERARFVLTYGRALGAYGADDAIVFFRENLAALSDAEHRRQVYLYAAGLLESEGRIDEAIEAYQGRL